MFILVKVNISLMNKLKKTPINFLIPLAPSQRLHLKVYLT